MGYAGNALAYPINKNWFTFKLIITLIKHSIAFEFPLVGTKYLEQNVPL